MRFKILNSEITTGKDVVDYDYHTRQIEKLEKDNKSLHKQIDEVKHLFEKICNAQLNKDLKEEVNKNGEIKP